MLFAFICEGYLFVKVTPLRVSFVGQETAETTDNVVDKENESEKNPVEKKAESSESAMPDKTTTPDQDMQAELQRYKDKMRFMEEQIRKMEEEKKAAQSSGF